MYIHGKQNELYELTRDEGRTEALDLCFAAINWFVAYHRVNERGFLR